MVEWKTIGDICYISDYVSNGSFASLRENVQYKNEPDYAILVRFADYSSGFDKSKFVYIDEHAYNFLSKSSLEGGEIIMSNVGSCGLLFRCPKLDRKMSLAPNSILIKSNYINYLYYWLGSNAGQEEIKKITSKSAMPKFNKTEFKKITLPLPSISEQMRIVGILDTFTASIENLKQQIAERRKQYEYYRDQLLDLEGKEGVEIKKIGSFGDVTKLAGFEFTEHVTYQDSGSIIALRGLNVREGQLDLSSVKYIDGSNFSKLSRSKLVKGDMLFTYVGTIGNVALIDENEKYYLAPNVSRIRFNNDVVNPKFALHYFLSDFFKRTQINKYLNSSSMKNLSMENIRKFEVYLPSLQEQVRIVSILDTFEASIANLEAQLKQREKQYEYYRNKLLTFE